MTGARLLALIYALWCVAVLLVLALADADGYSAFANGTRPIRAQAAVGPQHK